MNHDKTNDFANPSSDAKQVLVVDDHPVVREGLVGLIRRDERYEVCGQADSVESALDVVRTTHPDLILVDLILKGQDGLGLIREIRAMNKTMPILVISMQDELLYAERALRAGAQGYLMKDAVPEHIVAAMDALLRKELFVSTEVNKKMLRKYLEVEDRGDPELRGLSDRELHVFHCIAEGFTMQEVADQMGLSVKTIETYRENIKRKLGINSARELVRFSLAWAQGQVVKPAGTPKYTPVAAPGSPGTPARPGETRAGSTLAPKG